MLIYRLKEGCSKGTVSFFLYTSAVRSLKTGGISPSQKKEGDFMGRSKKITSLKKLQELWEEYKTECDNQMVLTHDFSSKNSEFVSKELKRSVTYTIEGFCVFADISRQAFYKNYASNDKYVDMVTRMREECEVDARKKFEIQAIPSQLAGLWMSRYGYSIKQDTDISASLSEEKTKLDNIIDQLRGDAGEE